MSGTWLPDSHSDVCLMCKTSFDLLIRRHHCRKCGGIYCGGCCSNYIKLPSGNSKDYKTFLLQWGCPSG